ncbi:MAG: hypothetical protein WC908_00480 [Candidatus Paceibacterota bacterium]
MEKFNLENNKDLKIGKNGQIDIDFEGAEKRERLEIAEKYHVLHPEKLEKKEDSKWYIDNMEVEYWDSLFSEKDNPYKIVKDNNQEIKKEFQLKVDQQTQKQKPTKIKHGHKHHRKTPDSMGFDRYH